MAVGAHDAPEILPVLLAQQDRFKAFLVRRLKDPATAEDVLQGAFEKVLVRGAAPRDSTRIAPWFFRLLRRSLIDTARHASAGRRALAARGRLTPTEDAKLHAQVCECVAALARTLAPEHREILMRTEVEGESVREAATKLGVTANSAAVRAHRARAALRRRVQDLCGACAEHRCLRCRCEKTQDRGSKSL
jgi:RNA polymerase sigma-70 factor, ECF subfamily